MSAAASPLRRRFQTAQAFLGALDSYWGLDGFVRHPEHPWLAFGACPSCKSKPLRRRWMSEGYPLIVVERPDGSFWIVPLCGCSEPAIGAALAAHLLRKVA